MPRGRHFVTVVVGLAAALGGAQAASARLSSPSRAARIGAEAYVYGLAPLDEQRVIVNFPPNLLISVTQLSTPELRAVVLPNVDTLYTIARLTVGGGPIVVHVPEEHGRYYTLELLDAYTNAFGYIGRRVSGTHPGNYAIIGPGWRGSLPPGVRPIRSPTPTVWLLGRTLVRSAADLREVNALQHDYTLTPLNDFGGSPLPDAFVPSSKLIPAPLPRGLAFYDALGAAMLQSPPPRSQENLLRRFASVGIGPGRSPSSEHLRAATRRGLLAGLAAGARELRRYEWRLERSSERRHGGWIVPPAATGRYRKDYLLRAYIAQIALGANIPAEAVYLPALVDHSLRRLTGRHRYVLHFAAGELPPVRAFWSLTMYGRGEFLVANPIRRYEIGDRTPGLRRGRDGSLDIVIQHAAPRRHRSNWLPAPRGPFRLVLRLYQPGAPVLRGTWPLPRITRVG